MLHVTLYNNENSGEVMHKRLNKIADREVSQYNDMAIETPILILSGLDADVLSQLNYVYIEEFERYYDCLPILLSDGNFQLTCEVDPLMSFADDILLLDAIVDKNQYESNMYYDDGSFITESRENIQLLNFSGGFNDTGRFILIAAGG